MNGDTNDQDMAVCTKCKADLHMQVVIETGGKNARCSDFGQP